MAAIFPLAEFGSRLEGWDFNFPQTSALLRGLWDPGLLDLHGAGSASHCTLSPRRSDLRPHLRRSDREESGSDREEFGSDREEFGSDREESSGSGLAPVVPVELRQRLDELDRRPQRGEE